MKFLIIYFSIILSSFSNEEIVLKQMNELNNVSVPSGIKHEVRDITGRLILISWENIETSSLYFTYNDETNCYPTTVSFSSSKSNPEVLVISDKDSLNQIYDILSDLLGCFSN